MSMMGLQKSLDGSKWVGWPVYNFILNFWKFLTLERPLVLPLPYFVPIVLSDSDRMPGMPYAVTAEVKSFHEFMLVRLCCY